jgi:hypothetical protein
MKNTRKCSSLRAHGAFGEHGAVCRAASPSLLLYTLSMMLSACATDAQLLNENRAAAIQAAVRQATRDLNCDQTAGSILSDSEVPGTPLGDLWSRYSIKATGCGKEIVYTVECENKTVCSVKHDEKR